MRQEPRLHRRLRFFWREELTCSSGVYLRRWGFETWIFSVRLHHWIHSDDRRAFHDHTWWFWTLILKGVYLDVSPAEENLDNDPLGEVNVERMWRGKLRFRPAHWKHYAYVPPEGCWTIILTGPKIRRFGFWVKDKFWLSYRYFYKFGDHPCD